MRRLLLTLAILVTALTQARAQNTNARYDNIAWSSAYVAGAQVLIPVANLNVQICVYPANAVPCTNFATLYYGPAVNSGVSPNPITSDAQGNFGFWAPAGYYQYTVTNSLGQSAGPYSVTLGGSSGGGGSGGATFPPTTGIVFNTSSTSSLNATSAQLATALNLTPTTPLVSALIPQATPFALGGVRPDGTTITISGAGVISSSGGGASLPATSLLYKGNGVVNGAVPATPGADYVIPSGSVANLFGTPTLPSGTAAFTQSLGDTSTKLATDAFVLANSTSTPATSSLLKGSGSANGVLAATPGTDYVIPSGSITGQSGTALAFAATPTPCTGSNLAGGVDIHGNAINCAAGGGAFPPAALFGQAPVSTGAGTSYLAQAVPLSFASFYNQYVAQLTTQTNWTTFAPNNIDNIFQVDGYSGNGNYAGVGVSPVAWTTPIIPTPISLSASTAPTNPSGNTWIYTFSSTQSSAGSNAWVGDSITISGYTAVAPATNGNNGTFVVTASSTTTVSVTNTTGATLNTGTPVVSQPNYSMCQVASYSGNYYIATDVINGTVTPGTNIQYWYPYPNAQASTAFDCAAYQAIDYATLQNHQTTLKMGSQRYTTNGIVFPSGLYSLSILGCGNQCSYLTYTGATAIPMFSKVQGSNFPSLQIMDMTMDGNQVASSCQDLAGLGISQVKNVTCYDVAPGSDHFIQWGAPGGTSFAMMADNVSVNTIVAGYGEPTTYPVITANLVGSQITSYTIVNGGTGQPTAAAKMYWLGNQNGTSNVPCTTQPTQPTLTYNGSGVLTGITPAGATPYGVGCVGTVDIQIHSLYPVNYGFKIYSSDSTYKDLYAVSGTTAGIINYYGNNHYIHPHPQGVNTGIINVGANITFEGTELDTIYGCGFLFEPLDSPNLTTTLMGTQVYTGGRLNPGSSPFCFAPGATNVVFSAMNSLWTPGWVPVDWHEFMTPAGPTDLGAPFPSGVSVLGNDPTSSSAQGDYDPLLTVGTLNVSTSLSLAAGGTVGSTDTGLPKFTFSADLITANQPVAAPSLLAGAPTTAAQNALPTGSKGFSCDETATAGVPANNVDYLRCDSVTHQIVASFNDGSEKALGSVVPVGYGGSSVTSNIAIGASALTANSSGASNVAIGPSALAANTSGANNVAVGLNALLDNLTGGSSVALGYGALAQSTGGSNVGIGFEALYSTLGGANNDAIGLNVMYSNTSGNYNMALGTNTLYANTSGSNNIAIGYEAGYTATAGNANVSGGNNTWLGYQAGPGTATQLNNASALGNGALNTASNQVSLGNSAVTTLLTNGTISLTEATAPGVSSNAGTGTLTHGTDNGGIIAVGAASTASTLTYHTAYQTWSSCTVSASTATAQPYVSAISATAVTFTYVTTGTPTLYYHCFGQ